MGLLIKAPVALVLLPLAAWCLFNYLRTMEVRLQRGISLRRDERPGPFWFWVGANCWVIFVSLAVLFFIPS